MSWRQRKSRAVGPAVVVAAASLVLAACGGDDDDGGDGEAAEGVPTGEATGEF